MLFQTKSRAGSTRVTSGAPERVELLKYSAVRPGCEAVPAVRRTEPGTGRGRASGGGGRRGGEILELEERRVAGPTKWEKHSLDHGTLAGGSNIPRRKRASKRRLTARSMSSVDSMRSRTEGSRMVNTVARVRG